MNDPERSPIAERLRHGLDAFEIDDSILPYFDGLGEQGREALLDIACDPSHDPSGHRPRAVFVLGRLGWRPAFRPLTKLLGDGSSSVRLHAIRACAEIGGPAAIEPLLEIATDEKRPLVERVHALRPLARIGDGEVLERLAEWRCAEAPYELRREIRDAAESLGRALRRSGC